MGGSSKIIREYIEENQTGESSSALTTYATELSDAAAGIVVVIDAGSNFSKAYAIVRGHGGSDEAAFAMG